jgi:SAM-dependent methyltransferase
MQPEHFSPAAERNKQPILDLLRNVLAPSGIALEIASGTGQHVAWFAQALPQWQWQPTDLQAYALESIASYAAAQQVLNVRVPLALNVLDATWPLGTPDSPQTFDLIYCANMLHIAPWECTGALMQGAARHLAPGGSLVTYGPFLENEVPTSAGNLAFDQSLRAQNPAWGIRQREYVEAEAHKAGLDMVQRHGLPANNLLLVWQHRAQA